MKPILTNVGCFTANGHFWNYQNDGPFPFDNCDDRTTSPEKRKHAIRQELLIEKLVRENILGEQK